MKKTLKMSLLGMASVATLAAPVALAVSCGSSDDNGVLAVAAFTNRPTATGTTSPTITPDAYKAQLVLDGADHAVTDKSFNESAYKAVTALGTQAITNGSTTIGMGTQGTPAGVSKPANDTVDAFKSAYTAAPANTILVLPGFMHIDPLTAYKDSMESKNQYAVLLDGDVVSPRVASVNFQAHQAAFEAGVLAGHYLNENITRFGPELKVATFGGLNIPTVTGSMAGFQKGIEYFNAHNDGMTDVIFMDNGSKADYFSGGFAPGGAKSISDKLVTNGADLIFPVAGPQATDVMASITSKNSKAQIIGVDTAQELDPSFTVGNESIVAFSALKNLTQAATSIMNAIAGNPVNGIKGLGEQTIGDLDNGLVGVSRPANVESIYDEAITTDVITAAKAMKLEFNY